MNEKSFLVNGFRPTQWADPTGSGSSRSAASRRGVAATGAPKPEAHHGLRVPAVGQQPAQFSSLLADLDGLGQEGRGESEGGRGQQHALQGLTGLDLAAGSVHPGGKDHDERFGLEVLGPGTDRANPLPMSRKAHGSWGSGFGPAAASGTPSG